MGEKKFCFFEKKFLFVVKRWYSTSCAICAWAVCPKSLMCSYLEERIGTLRFALISLANAMALACVLALSIILPFSTMLYQLAKLGFRCTLIILNGLTSCNDIAETSRVTNVLLFSKDSVKVRCITCTLVDTRNSHARSFLIWSFPNLYAIECRPFGDMNFFYNWIS